MQEASRERVGGAIPAAEGIRQNIADIEQVAAGPGGEIRHRDLAAIVAIKQLDRVGVGASGDAAVLQPVSREVVVPRSAIEAGSIRGSIKVVKEIISITASGRIKAAAIEVKCVVSCTSIKRIVALAGKDGIAIVSAIDDVSTVIAIQGIVAGPA